MHSFLKWCKRQWNRLYCRHNGHCWRVWYLAEESLSARCWFINQTFAVPCVRCGTLTGVRYFESPEHMLALPEHITNWESYKHLKNVELMEWTKHHAGQAS